MQNPILRKSAQCHLCHSGTFPLHRGLANAPCAWPSAHVPPTTEPVATNMGLPGRFGCMPTSHRPVSLLFVCLSACFLAMALFCSNLVCPRHTRVAQPALAWPFHPDPHGNSGAVCNFCSCPVAGIRRLLMEEYRGYGKFHGPRFCCSDGIELDGLIGICNESPVMRLFAITPVMSRRPAAERGFFSTRHTTKQRVRH